MFGIENIHNIRIKSHYFLYLLAATLPLSAFSFLNFKTRAITWDWVVMASLISFCFAEGLLDKHVKIPQTSLFFWLMLFNLFLLLSGIDPLFSGEKNRLIDFLTTWLQYELFILGFFMVLTFKVNPAFVRSLLRWYLIVAGSVALFGLIQVVAAWGFNIDLYPKLTHIKYTKTETGYGSYLGGLSRAASIFEEPRQFGVFLVVPFFIALRCLKQGQTSVFKTKYMRWGICLILIVGLLVSFSVSAYIELLLGIVLTSVILFRWQDTIKICTFIFIGGVFFIVITESLFGVSVIDYLSHRLYAFTYGREVWQFNFEIGGVARYIRGALFGFEILFKNPIFGIGVNQFRSLNLYGYEWVRILPPFELIASVGIFGSISFACFFIILIRKALILKRHISIYLFELDSALLLVSITLFLSLVGSGYNYSSSLFWFPVYFASIIIFNVKYWYRHLDKQQSNKDH